MYPHLNMTNPVVHGMTMVLGNPNGSHPKHTPLIHSHMIHMCIWQMGRVTVALTLTPAVTMAMKPGQLLRVPRPANRQPNSTGPIPVLRHVGGHSWASRPAKHAGLLGEQSTKVEKVGKTKHGKPKGKITNTSSYLSELNESQLMEIFPAFRAKGGKKGAGSGKGKGRKGNPRGPDGRRMKCHECGSEEHLVAKCPRRAAAGDTSQNLFVDLDTADQIPPGVITPTTVLMVNEVDVNVGQESGTDHWSTVSGGPPSNASTLPAVPQDPWANSDPWRRYHENRTGRQVVGGIVNPMPPLPRTTRTVDMADQSLYMQSVFNGLNGLMHPTTEPRSFGPPLMNQFTHNTPLATNPMNNPPQNNPTNPQGRNVNNEPFSQQPVAESTTIQEPYVAQNMQPPPMQLPQVQRHEVLRHPTDRGTRGDPHGDPSASGTGITRMGVNARVQLPAGNCLGGACTDLSSDCLGECY